MASRADILGVVLAGGQARRMGGGDKCMIPVQGRPILAHLLDHLRPQIETIVLNANGEPGRFAATELPVLSDVVADQPGPLAGVLTGLSYIRQARPELKGMISVPGDTPFLPRDLVARLMAPIDEGRAELSCAASNGRTNPVIGYWPIAIIDDLQAALEAGTRKIDRFTAGYTLAQVAFESGGIDAFFNINTPEDVETANSHIQSGTS